MLVLLCGVFLFYVALLGDAVSSGDCAVVLVVVNSRSSGVLELSSRKRGEGRRKQHGVWTAVGFSSLMTVVMGAFYAQNHVVVSIMEYLLYG